MCMCPSHTAPQGLLSEGPLHGLFLGQVGDVSGEHRTLPGLELSVGGRLPGWGELHWEGGGGTS